MEQMPKTQKMIRDSSKHNILPPSTTQFKSCTLVNYIKYYMVYFFPSISQQN